MRSVKKVNTEKSVWFVSKNARKIEIEKLSNVTQHKPWNKMKLPVVSKVYQSQAHYFSIQDS